MGLEGVRADWEFDTLAVCQGQEDDRPDRPGDAGASRDLPIALIGTAGGALALWANAPAEIAVPVVLLIALDIRVRRSRHRP
ncbi:hypothetical protein [Streptomyces sp. enrichment culture]|uniref:hypothetical protein n=1 Tax=Streptomyces sp. enrichment culture TaxID=1795815 RepID=UPI003F56686B